jgi:phosphinothricin acetyltransferase
MNEIKTTSDLYIRPVTPDDASALADIYAYYVENTAVSFEYDPPTAEEFRGRIVRTLERYPYLAAIRGERIVGYAYAREFVGRKACEHCVEVSVYVAHDCRRCGAGRALYEEMERALGGMGILNVYASIAYSDSEDEFLTRDSIEFHTRMGYAQCARFHRCGYKFGNWYDLVWVEKFLPDSGSNVKN